MIYALSRRSHRHTHIADCCCAMIGKRHAKVVTNVQPELRFVEFSLFLSLSASLYVSVSLVHAICRSSSVVVRCTAIYVRQVVVRLFFSNTTAAPLPFIRSNNTIAMTIPKLSRKNIHCPYRRYRRDLITALQGDCGSGYEQVGMKPSDEGNVPCQVIAS